jgi:hypothetical protein
LSGFNSHHLYYVIHADVITSTAIGLISCIYLTFYVMQKQNPIFVLHKRHVVLYMYKWGAL